MTGQQVLPSFELVEYQRKWLVALNRGDPAGADEAFVPDAIIHITGAPTPDLDLASFKQMLGGFFAAFPDLTFTIADQIDAGDRVAMRWFAEGTHTGPLGAAPATGKRIHIEGIIFDRVVDGRVAERWEQWDQPAMLRQLGFA